MVDPEPPSPADLALAELLRGLEAAGYDFVTPTPATHQRILSRPRAQGPRSLRDVLGWSLPFDRPDLPPGIFRLLEEAGILEPLAEGVRSTVRVSRLHGRLFLHSAYPTEAPDAVFFGPDSYRFADFIVRTLDPATSGPLVDVGGGAGVGAIVAAGLAPSAEILLSDVNPKALRLARVNAAHAGVPLRLALADGLDAAPEGLAAVIANPPYMAASKQVYRDGGGPHGAGLSLAWAAAALSKLGPGGQFLLYTGSAILQGGQDPIRQRLTELAARRGARMDYAEIDPDVFGEELDRPAYAEVERIAVVGCVMTLPG